MGVYAMELAGRLWGSEPNAKLEKLEQGSVFMWPLSMMVSRSSHEEEGGQGGGRGQADDRGEEERYRYTATG